MPVQVTVIGALPAPTLHIERATPNQILVSWVADDANWTLKGTDDLENGLWQSVGSAQLVDGRYTVTLPIGPGNKFLRLEHLLNLPPAFW